MSYRSNDVDTRTLSGDALPGSTGKLNSIAVMVNLLVDFNDRSSFTPCVGAGLGFSKIDADGFGVTPIPGVLNDDSTAFAYQFIAGAGWGVSQQTEIFLEYRYCATENADAKTSAATG